MDRLHEFSDEMLVLLGNALFEELERRGYKFPRQLAVHEMPVRALRAVRDIYNLIRYDVFFTRRSMDDDTSLETFMKITGPGIAGQIERHLTEVEEACARA